jgi:hypothetical protein
MVVFAGLANYSEMPGEKDSGKVDRSPDFRANYRKKSAQTNGPVIACTFDMRKQNFLAVLILSAGLSTAGFAWQASGSGSQYPSNPSNTPTDSSGQTKTDPTNPNSSNYPNTSTGSQTTRPNRNGSGSSTTGSGSTTGSSGSTTTSPNSSSGSGSTTNPSSDK